jgi:hypothetical protein
MKGEDGSRAPWMVMQTWKERRTGSGKQECPVCLPSYTSSGIQDNCILRQEAGLENRKNFKSTLIPTTSPSSDLRSRIYVKVPRSTVQRALDRCIISVCGTFFLNPSHSETVSKTSHVALSPAPVGPSFFDPTVFCLHSEGLRSDVSSVPKISITVVV